MSKLLSEVSNDFKTYQFTIVDQHQDEEEAVSKQEVLDDHELKVMEPIDLIGELIGEPSQTKTTCSPENYLTAHQSNVSVPPSMNSPSVNRHFNLLEELVETIRRAV